MLLHKLPVNIERKSNYSKDIWQITVLTKLSNIPLSVCIYMNSHYKRIDKTKIIGLFSLKNADSSGLDCTCL